MKTETQTENKAREQKLALLESDYLENYSGNFYPNEFKPQGYLTECNFGGCLVILGSTGDSLLIWRDWAGEAVDEKLTECEIEYSYKEETDENEAYFMFEGDKIDLYSIMNINN